MDQHPIQVSFGTDLTRSRVTTFFRALICLPHMVWLMIWGIGAGVAQFLNFWATLFAGTSPEGLHNFLSRYVNYMTRVNAYYLYLSEPYPSFSLDDAYDVNVYVAPRAPQNRWHTLFRAYAQIPAVIVALVYAIPLIVGVGIGFFAILITGKQPEAFQRWGERYLLYATRLQCYGLYLTSRYPNSSVDLPPTSSPSQAGEFVAA
jgi:hypothetical protein